MIRLLFGSALPLLGLGIAAMMLGPDLVTGPRGEPLVMAASDPATLQPASFEGADCPSTLLHADRSPGKQRVGPAGTRIMAFALRSGDKHIAVRIEDFSDAGSRPGKTVVLIFDKAGRLVAAGDLASPHLPEAAVTPADCGKMPETGPHTPI